MKELLIQILSFFGRAYWVEIVTETPRCTYYFGPFVSQQEANVAKTGYIEDLQTEGAQGMSVAVKRCKPTKLTIFDEPGERSDREKTPTLSGQPS